MAPVAAAAAVVEAGAAAAGLEDVPEDGEDVPVPERVPD
jgi:hypothetical protein